ncbi:MAG: glycoside hydrolase family 15 protein [Micromonosporaceae bacterium]
MTGADRRDGYAPISSYAALGDGRTVALVATDGAIDWLPVPVIDAPPAFAAVLDAEHGGRLELEPAVEYSATRRYRPGTPVLETIFATAAGTVTAVDALNRQGGHPLPWTELARVVRADGGEVPMRWQVAPGRRFGSAEPWTQLRDGTPLIRLGDQSLAVITQNAGSPQVGPHGVSGEFTAVPGTASLLAVTATDSEPVMVPPAERVMCRVEATTDGWRAWRRRIRYAGPHADAVVRSALTLRLLTIAAQGANAAAATTSLPEAVGGDRNYDYRFTWVRDASFALDALANLGLIEEVHSVLSWLLRAVARTAPDIHVFYTLGGDPAPEDQQEITSMLGYRRTGPVRAGNAAAGQRQLGGYGHLMDAVHHYVRHGGHLNPATGAMLAGMADKACDLWREPDAGLWELPSYQHYTSSKIGCWVALDRAVWLAERNQLPGWNGSRWRTCRDEIRAWVDQHCWSAAKNSYTMYAGTDDLDAAVLLAARTGFCGPGESRLNGTIEAIRCELTATGPLLYRYSAIRGEEGAFTACSFWLAEALAHTGRPGEACAVFDGTLRYCNDVGLLSEEIDPNTGDLLGNFPQGLSHLALIGAAHMIARSATGQGCAGARRAAGTLARDVQPGVAAE